MKRKQPENSHDEKEAKQRLWAFGLLKTMKDEKYIVQKYDKLTIIKDMYPKARYHYLVIPQEDISSLKILKGDQLPLLEHMDQAGRDFIGSTHPDITFKLGYHSEASMHRLHLHVISEDMNSPCLKTKNHWNSFNTSFFLESKDVIDNLQKNNKVVLPSKEKCKEFKDAPLKCHKCHFTPKNMPDLKLHILTHLQV